jgi:transporter family protein
MSLWLYFSLTAAMCWSIATIIDEHVVDKYINNPLLNAMLYSMIGLIAGIAVFIIQGPYPLDAIELLLCLMSGMAYTITIAMYFLALKKEEVTRVVPLMSIASIFTVILATVFLKESFLPVQYLGIGLIIMGSILISIKLINDKDRGLIFKMSGAIILMGIGAFVSAISAVTQKYLINSSIPFEIVFGYSRIGVAIPAILIFFLAANEIRRLVSEKKHHVFKYMLGSESITMLGTFSIFAAMSMGPVSLVSSIVTIEPLFTLILASLIGIFVPKLLQQELNKVVIFQKLTAVLLIIFGLVLVAV